MPDRAVSRRAVLLGALGAAVAACTRSPTAPPAPPGAPSPTTPGRSALTTADAAVSARAALDERGLLACYEATVTRHRALRAALAPYADEHRAHLRALGAAGGQGGGGQGGGGQGGSAESGRIPRGRRRALGALVLAERAAAAARVQDAVDATAPGLAELLAAVGGCEASHAALLDSR